MQNEHALYMVAMIILLSFSFYCSILFVLKDGSLSYKLIGVVVFFSALSLAVQRDTYLPFLYKSAFPPALVKDVHTPENANADTTISVNEPDGTRIAYWGALPSKQVQKDPYTAYGPFTNSGVVVVNKGKANIKFWCPAKYNVPWGATIDRHIHYRVLHPKGMMSRVYTVFVKC
jgi:hypothetical protein